MAVFDLAALRKSRPGAEQYRLVLRRFVVQQGDTLAIVGPSGCGKSTALDLLACALRPDAPAPEAHFFFTPEENSIDVLAAWQRGNISYLAQERMRHTGYVLQTGGLLPFLTARDNITLVCKVLNTMPANIAAMRQTIETLGISHLLDKYPAQLSVGERQRVAIARALAHGPAVILADEPTAALDPAHSRGVMELFLRLARSQGCTVIMVSHDQALAREVGFTLVPITVQTSKDGVCAELDWTGEV